MAGIVTLLTDFGLEDPYVGVMKGVMLSCAPELRLVDLTHQIPPQDVGAASFWLRRAYHWFPEGTVHLVVVDPGVGSQRRAVALECDGHLFVGPDNGVFASLDAGAVKRVVAIEPERRGLTQISRTFHGRDVFAPVAAELARGATSVADLGPECELVPLSGHAGPKTDGAGLTGFCGQVMVCDHFGNLISDVEGLLLTGASNWQVTIAGRRLRVVGTYAEAEEQECVALVGSFGTLEIAARNASAAKLLGVTSGERIIVERH